MTTTPKTKPVVTLAAFNKQYAATLREWVRAEELERALRRFVDSASKLVVRERDVKSAVQAIGRARRKGDDAYKDQLSRGSK